MTDATILTVPGDLDAAIARQWDRLGLAGTWLTGVERLQVACIARSGRANDDAGTEGDAALDEPSALVASLVGSHASTVTGQTVDHLESLGLRRQRYVEIVGVVSRVLAVDTFERGIGRPLRKLPRPVDGTPSRHTVAGAKRRAGWVPTVGAISPPTALSAVSDEAVAQAELHRALYLSYEDMADLTAVRELTRAQMELVAARVSYLNDCRY